MDIKCTKEELNRVVGIALRACPSKSTMPILECLLFTADNDEIRVTANDTELGIEVTAEGEIKENGKVAIDAKLLASIVSKLPNGDVHIKTDETTAKITCGKAKFNIATKDGDAFPEIETVERKDCVTISQDELKLAIFSTVFAVSNNDNNKIMTGELVEITDKLRVTALDGHRIAISELEMNHEPISAIIPGKSLSEVAKMPFKGDVKIYFTDAWVQFVYDNATVTTRLIDGKYFDIGKILSGEFTTTLKTDRKGFIECLDRALLLANEMERKPAILNISDEISVEMIANTGSMKETLTAEKDGEDLKIGINPRFLLDALKAIDDDEVTLSMINPKAPIQIIGEGYRHVVLPINLG